MGKRKKITKEEKQWIQNEVERLKKENSLRLKETIDPHANFINVLQGYFNKGKYKGIPVNKVPSKYIEWVKENIELNKTEMNYLNKILHKKQ